MPAWQRLCAADIGRIFRPDLLRFVVAADAARRAPQQQQRAPDSSAGFEVLGVRLEIDPEGRAIVLAHGVDGLGIAEAAHVLRKRFFVEEAQTLLGLCELLANE